MHLSQVDYILNSNRWVWLSPCDKDTFKHWVSCHVNRTPKKSLYCFPLCLHVFTHFCFSLLSFLFGLQCKNKSSAPPPKTHKTNPCPYDCVICFSFVIVGLFLSKPTTNNDRKWEREERSTDTSFIFLILCTYEMTQFSFFSSSPLFHLLFSLFPSPLNTMRLDQNVKWPVCRHNGMPCWHQSLRSAQAPIITCNYPALSDEYLHFS